MSEIKNREFLILSKAKQLVFDIDDIFIRVITRFLTLYIYAYKKINLF